VIVFGRIAQDRTATVKSLPSSSNLTIEMLANSPAPRWRRGARATRLQRESATSPFVFVSERGLPFTSAGLARMNERAAAVAGLELPCSATPAATPSSTRATTLGRAASARRARAS
jgi:hypothetical protein